MVPTVNSGGATCGLGEGAEIWLGADACCWPSLERDCTSRYQRTAPAMSSRPIRRSTLPRCQFAIAPDTDEDAPEEATQPAEGGDARTAPKPSPKPAPAEDIQLKKAVEVLKGKAEAAAARAA